MTVNVPLHSILNTMIHKLKENNMSSSIDNITCPQCGGNALRETDHKTGEIYDYCTECDYEEFITEGE